MKKAEVRYWMVESDTGGYVSGISKHGIFTEKEIKDGKHKELIKDIKLIKGCNWSYNIKWI